MATVITKDKAWLEKEIEDGIEAFLDCEHEHIVTMLRKYVLQQIFVSGCSINIESENDEKAILSVIMDIPDPNTCTDVVNDPRHVQSLDHRIRTSYDSMQGP